MLVIISIGIGRTTKVLVRGHKGGVGEICMMVREGKGRLEKMNMSFRRGKKKEARW